MITLKIGKTVTLIIIFNVNTMSIISLPQEI